MIFSSLEKISTIKYLRTKWYGLDCVAYRTSQIWQTFPIEIKDSISLKIFKNQIKILYIAIRVHATAANPTFTNYNLFKCDHYMAYISIFWCKWGIIRSLLILFIIFTIAVK